MNHITELHTNFFNHIKPKQSRYNKYKNLLPPVVHLMVDRRERPIV